MPTPPRWFDRSFEFLLPIALHPVVTERLRGLLPRVRAKVADTSAARRVAVDGDTWSIQENLGHLADLEPLWLGRLEDFLADTEVLRPADLENRRTFQRRHNERPIDEVVDELETLRGRLLARLDDLAEVDFARLSKHPRLDQPMRLLDHLVFVAEHDDHHLARITALARG